MTTPFIIDAHEDLAHESLYGGFDYTRSVADNRKFYSGPEKFLGTIGWPELQKGRIGIIFGTVFMQPPSDQPTACKNRETTYVTGEDFHAAVLAQLDFYDRLADGHPELYSRIFSRADLDAAVKEWSEDPDHEHPVRLVTLLEGCEGLRSFDDHSIYYERGIRLIGPVWKGGRWCSGTKSNDIKDELTDEGKTLLRNMEDRGFILDVSHMRNHSAMDALNYYDGVAAASHVNCNALLPGFPFERHFNDETIRLLIEHDGVMGVIPFNFFLMADWDRDGKMPRSAVTLDTLANHIDHICQLAGHSRTAAIGTDFDGGFGFPEIPYEMDNISDLPKLAEVLKRRGYGDEDIENIFHKNWMRVLERGLK